MSATPPAAPADPIGELAHRMDGVIARAVHPDEIAAVLESDGMTDDHIRSTYGRADSFALAEALHERVPRRYPEPSPPAADPWWAGLLGCLLRGLVFALPGLAYTLAAPLLEGAALGPLLAGALTGWAWNQALSHRAHSWSALGDRPAALRCLRTGTAAGALLSTAAAVVCAGPGQGHTAVFASAQALYGSAATALLVLGRERALLYALLPTAGGTVVTLLHDLPPWSRSALLLASLAAATGLAVHATRPESSVTGRNRARRPAGTARDRPGAPTARPRPPHRPRVLASLPYGVFGLGAGTLVLYTALGDVLAGRTGAAVAAPAAVALTLSMGPAEWLLRRFRDGTVAGLRASITRGEFRRCTAAVLAECLCGYLATLFAIAVAGTVLWPGAPALGGVRSATLLLVGAVLWTGLLLQSSGAANQVAAVCAGAAAVQTLALLTGTGGPALVGLCVAAASASVLAVLVCVLLGRATAHRL
ncbi:hypothetical protein GLX30_25725 [Streptomyces sp. Tu 2975]|uniref:hypothetical protein n=1 Tax=Streptomyces sp. Tu 2975 TaxID=2676871 RepID=UPI0013570E36|nr:hypothetical protein [Streptomyces sp. Tu 2975]QIP86859.1 hypothetical protein GLX30_25725 [Streptomyces sp. Tu 2975]